MESYLPGSSMIHREGNLVGMGGMNSITECGRPVNWSVRGILQQTGKVLLLQRSGKSSLNPLAWEIPGGSRDPEEDMSPKDTLYREFPSETGIQINVGRLLGIWSTCDNRNPNTDGIYLTIIYIVSLMYPGEGPFSPERRVVLSHEHCAHAWVEPLPRILRRYRLHPDTSMSLEEYMRTVLKQPVELMAKGAEIQRQATLSRLNSWIAKHSQLSLGDIETLLACIELKSF